MLVEFVVKNFKCIKEEQKLSMVSASKKNAFAFSTKHKVVEKLLPAAGIFGANASGKSTVSEAIEFLRIFVLTSYKNRKGDKIDVTPFLLDNKAQKEPTELEITFIQNKKLYRYGFSVDAERVWEEWLYVIPQDGRTNEVFTRLFDEEKKEYVWNINDKLIKGPKVSWSQLTNQTSSFLSVVMQYSDEASDATYNEVFNDTFTWFGKKLYTLQQDEIIHSSYTATLFEEQKTLSERVLSFLRSLDFDINDIHVDKVKIPDSALKNIPKDIREKVKFSLEYEIKFGRLNNKGKEIRWDIKNESGGTQKLFCMAGPIMETLESGSIFVVDELHNNFHPHLLEAVIKLFQSPATNKHNAQLVFTSHDVTPMNPCVLSSDQVWFTDKEKDKSTHLVPLSIYKPREGSIYSKQYLDGRFGAVPNIKELTSL